MSCKPESDGKSVSFGNSNSPQVCKGQKRVKQLDARALENLLRWSIDLIERQQNLLKTALEVVTSDLKK